MLKKFIVITTINSPSEAILEFAKLEDHKLIVVADLKTPKNWKIENENVIFVSIEEQLASKLHIYESLPWNHYSRKMFGYLKAIKLGAEQIIDTDDDNYPLDNTHFKFPPTTGYFDSTESALGGGFINIYKYFTTEHIWPRGLPLNLVRDKKLPALVESKVNIGIWQSLADGDSDVDAIYRMTSDKHIKFENRNPVVLGKGSFAPFNSQSTLFTPKTFPLLYLPAFVSFRFTDILRGIVAQPILQSANLNLGFISPIVRQDRNEHDYFKDFESEITMYLQSQSALDLVKSKVTSEKSIIANLQNAYEILSQAGIVDHREINLLHAWLHDLDSSIIL